MSKRTVVLLSFVFAIGIAVGALARGMKVDPSSYRGKSKKEAATSLLEIARKQAGEGSWENIAVGRVYDLGGMKKEGQDVFDGLKKKQPSDWMRIGRIYREAGELDKAKDAFDRALLGEPQNAAWLAELGAFYNLKGDRTKAEEMFDKSFQYKADEVWHTVNMAGSYVGVEPRGDS
jgi:tetratricopeptide (TPR) repeat protein